MPKIEHSGSCRICTIVTLAGLAACLLQPPTLLHAVTQYEVVSPLDFGEVQPGSSFFLERERDACHTTEGDGHCAILLPYEEETEEYATPILSATPLTDGSTVIPWQPILYCLVDDGSQVVHTPLPCPLREGEKAWLEIGGGGTVPHDAPPGRYTAVVMIENGDRRETVTAILVVQHSQLACELIDDSGGRVTLDFGRYEAGQEGFVDLNPIGCSVTSTIPFLGGTPTCGAVRFSSPTEPIVVLEINTQTALQTPGNPEPIDISIFLARDLDPTLPPDEFLYRFGGQAFINSTHPPGLYRGNITVSLRCDPL